LPKWRDDETSSDEPTVTTQSAADPAEINHSRVA